MSQTTVEPLVDESFNLAAIRGQLVTDVRISELSSGSVVHNFEMKTGRGGERHVVPVAWHDPARPPQLVVGHEVVVVGVVRRRWFRAGGGSQSRTEVLATSVAKAGSRRAVNSLAKAVEMLYEADVSRG